MSLAHLIMETIGRYKKKIYSNFELAQIFPGAGPILRRLNKEYSKQISSYDPLKNEIREVIHRLVKRPSDNENLTWLYMNVYVNVPVQKLLDKIEKNKTILKFIKQNKDIEDGKYTNTDIPLDTKIERAKQIPITDFIQFNRTGFANCIWHNDKNPSMKYYKKTNSVFCWACQKNGDVIDIIQKLNSTDFVGAVNFLVK